jgi:anti-sigma factor (TIGR02949 family)
MNTIKFPSRECERVRGQLDAYLSNELLVETTNDIVKHLEGCEACWRELDSRTRVREALRRAAVKRLPPEDFREAVHQRLRKAQPGMIWQVPTTWAAAVAAALALVVIGGALGQQWIWLQRGRQMVASVLALGVADHLHCAIKGHNYPEVANPPDQLRQKLGPEYAGLLEVVEAKLPGFQVLEDHICTVPGSPRKYVHFIARGRGTILSVILTKRDGESLPAQRLLVTKDSSGSDLYNAELEGTSVAGFETNEYFGFVVSNLAQNEVLQLASAIAPPLRNALDRSTGAETLATPVFLVASVSSGSAQNFK